MQIVFSGWFAVNILAPLFLPFIGLMALKLLPLGSGVSDNLRFMAIVKDGQLCWAAIAMGASSLYESWTALEANRQISGGGVLLLTCCMMLPAIILAAAGGVFSTPLLKAPSGGFRKWCSHYKVFVGSSTLCTLTAIAYTYLHSQLS
jgi:hypothetical protein